MKPVLVLGDSGLLGQALVARGRARGLLIRGASRRSSDLALDALNCSALEQALDVVQPATLINTVDQLRDLIRQHIDPAFEPL